VAVEWHIYFLFPLLVLAWRRFGGGKTTVSIFVLAYITYFAVRRTPLGGLIPHFLFLFALGMLAAVIATSQEPAWSKMRGRVPWYVVAFVSFAVVIGLCRYWPWGEAFKQYPLLDPILAIGVVAILISTTARADDPLRRFLSARPLAWCGRFSYSIYLIHAVLVQVVFQYFVRRLHLPDWQSFLLMIAVGIPFTIAVSYLFFLGCERPFLTSSPKRAQVEPGI
jgi:peptidoglycan/LPS O-acetylase OafA/YrhL